MARSGRSSLAFLDLDSQTLKQLLVRLKFTPLSDWPSTLIAALIRFQGPGEWNGNNNDRTFLMVGVSA